MEGHTSSMMINNSSTTIDNPITHTTSPIVTGTTVIAIKYKDGIMMMADTLGSYGTMARFTNLKRLHEVNNTCMIAASGEWSDFQYISKLLQELSITDVEEDDGHTLNACQVTSYLSRVLYNRRSKVNPLWNQLAVGGFHEGKPYLGVADLYGSYYEENVLATGFGSYLVMPLLRKQWRADINEEAARKLLIDCSKVLLYRDCKAFNKFNLGTVTSAGVKISEPFSIDTKWDFKFFINP